MHRIFIWLMMAVLLFACRKHQPATTTWKTWRETDTPVFRGQYPLTGDPAVVRESDLLRMFYTGFDPYLVPQGPEICEATSPDGFSWTNVSLTDSVQGRILFTSGNNWNTAHETSYALKWNNRFYLWFIGYRDSGAGVFGSGPVSIGFATSVEGVHFNQENEPAPVIRADHAFSSGGAVAPSVLMDNTRVRMWYHGFSGGTISIGYAEAAWPLVD